jgi:hypothetical protein
MRPRTRTSTALMFNKHPACGIIIRGNKHNECSGGLGHFDTGDLEMKRSMPGLTGLARGSIAAVDRYGFTSTFFLP